MAKILCVLYDDPITGYPKTYARNDIPRIDHYAGGQKAPTPDTSTSLSERCWKRLRRTRSAQISRRSLGHTFVVTSDKEGPNSIFERELPDADVVISQPFWPAYLTADRIAKAKKLKLAITAGIGSDHVDLEAAIKNGHHRCGSHLLEQHQRVRACDHDDPGARRVTIFHPTSGLSREAGTLRTVSSDRMTLKQCTWVRSPPGASVSPDLYA